MLRGAIESVLSQSFPDFRLVISDNASDDDTLAVVESFADSRIDYIRSDRNIGMIANFNRVIDLSDTEFLVVLPDDDFLYPEYLRSVIDVLDRYPTVGVVHTAFDVIDGNSRVIERDKHLLDTTQAITVESSHEFLERSMRSSWIVCFSSAIYRAEAIVDSEGLRAEEEPFSDIPMWMRIALEWDFAFLAEPLVAFRLHESSATVRLTSDSAPRILRARRTGFLDEVQARLSPQRLRRYRTLTEQTFRSEEIRRLAINAGVNRSWRSATVSLLQFAREEPRVVFVGGTWRLVAAQLGGRQARRALLRLAPGEAGRDLRNAPPRD
jgi:glycosyltransferase involved in cell wall biosynthesis